MKSDLAVTLEPKNKVRRTSLEKRLLNCFIQIQIQIIQN